MYELFCVTGILVTASYVTYITACSDSINTLKKTALSKKTSNVKNICPNISQIDYRINKSMTLLLSSLGYTYERLDGSVRGEERFLAVQNFNQNDETFVFLLSTKAGLYSHFVADGVTEEVKDKLLICIVFICSDVKCMNNMFKFMLPSISIVSYQVLFNLHQLACKRK